MATSAPAAFAASAFSSDETAATTRAPIRLAELDRGQADAAGRAEHEQGLALLEPAPVEQGVDGRRIGEDQRRSLLEAAAFGQRQRHRRGDQHLLGEAAMAEHRDQPVARRPAGDALPRRLDHAGDLAAGRERARRA